MEEARTNKLLIAANEDRQLARPDFVHELMTEQEAAVYLGLSRSGMRKWRARGFGPAYCRFGKIIRYRRSSLDEFADRHTSSSAESVSENE